MFLKKSDEVETMEKIAEKRNANHYYLKISIPNNENYYGKRIKLFNRGKLIWGIEIERGPNGYPIEYRNIIVPDNNVLDYQLNDMSIEYAIDISETQFSTSEQDEYDLKYKVKEEDGLYFAKHGNEINPRKILVTFPGFGPSTTRISYAISSMTSFSTNQIIMDNMLIVAMQDRYYSAGNYMLETDFGEALYPRFCRMIQKLLTQYQLQEEDLIFFGASKGGNIALRYFENFTKGHLIISAAQLHLLYYFQSKPFFRNNLFHVYKNIQDNTRELLKRYIEQNASVNFLYTDNDELSNYGITNMLTGTTSFRKYRIAGAHGAITNKAMITIEHLVTRLVEQSNEVKPLDYTNFEFYREDNRLYAKCEIPMLKTCQMDVNMYLGFQDEDKRLMLLQNITRIENTAYFIAKEDEYIDLDYDFSKPVKTCVLYMLNRSGEVYKAKIDYPLEQSQFHTFPNNLDFNQPQGMFDYVVINKNNKVKYTLEYQKSGKSETLYIINDFPQQLANDSLYLKIASATVYNEENLSILHSRIAKKAKVKRIVFHTNESILLTRFDFVNKQFYFHNLDTMHLFQTEDAQLKYLQAELQFLQNKNAITVTYDQKQHTLDYIICEELGLI
ncbi:MAG: hypothetical protein ACRCV7_04425 [Culicoidibacterales bacterium]